jgi:hypothetical protein
MGSSALTSGRGRSVPSQEPGIQRPSDGGSPALQSNFYGAAVAVDQGGDVYIADKERSVRSMATGSSTGSPGLGRAVRIQRRRRSRATRSSASPKT